MIGFLKRHAETIVVSAIVAAITAGGPTIAHGVRHSLFAHNSAKLANKTLNQVANHATRANLRVRQTASRLSFDAGEEGQVTYTVVIRNMGPGLAQGVDLRHDGGGHGTAVSASNTGCLDTVQAFNCVNVASKLAPGGSLTVSFTYHVSCNYDPGWLSSPGATLSAWQFDPRSSNNEASTVLTCSPA